MSQVDFSLLTEIPGLCVHPMQLSAMVTRYDFARNFCEGKDVLEVACGPGIGLGYIAQVAKRVVGGDIDNNCLKFARETYKNNSNIELIELDAQEMQFEDCEFDVVIMYEALYYLPHPEKFFREANRVLKPGGVLLVVNVNKDWWGFNPSPHSYKYLSVAEFEDVCNKVGLEPEIRLAFYDDPDTLLRKIKALIRKGAVSFSLIPGTMKAKQRLKRLFYGDLRKLPPRISGTEASVEETVVFSGDTEALEKYEVIYVVGRKAC